MNINHLLSYYSCCDCIGFANSVACEAHLSRWNQYWSAHQRKRSEEAGDEGEAPSKSIRFWTKEKLSIIFRLSQWQVNTQNNHIFVFKWFKCEFSISEHFGGMFYSHQHISQKEMDWYSKQLTRRHQTTGHSFHADDSNLFEKYNLDKFQWKKHKSSSIYLLNVF